MSPKNYRFGGRKLVRTDTSHRFEQRNAYIKDGHKSIRGVLVQSWSQRGEANNFNYTVGDRWCGMVSIYMHPQMARDGETCLREWLR